MTKRFFLNIMFSFSLLFPLTASAIPFSNLFAFGDSLSDTGNVAAFRGITLPPPYYENRISNGPLAVDVLASKIGMSAAPSLLGGTNFSVAGARAGGTDTGDLAFQLTSFMSGGYDPSTALNLVFIGGNDVRDAAGEINDSDATNILQGAIIGIDTTIRTLISSGAEQILVPNVFDIGLIPESYLIDSVFPGYQARATALTGQFNAALLANLALIEFETGVDIMEFDLFDFTQNIFANSDTFGFLNTTESCLVEVPVLAPPKPECNFETYAFFDTIHPTAKFHELIGNALASSVPEPITFQLMTIGLVALWFMQRRRHRLQQLT